FFFFQAEDGIRDGHVTGVQTCALPISLLHAGHLRGQDLPPEASRRLEEMSRKSLEIQKRIEAADTLDFESYREKYLAHDTLIIRSEERRVGKECRYRGTPYD